MKEYIVLTDEEELYYNSFNYHELIHCMDCRFYEKIIAVCNFVGQHEGICKHPQGCVDTDSWGYCHYALRKEDVLGEDPEA